MHIRPIPLAALALAGALLACSTLVPAGPDPGPEPSGPATEESPAASPTPTFPPAPARPRLWMCGGCGGSTIWQLGPGEATQIELPFALGRFHDHSPVSQRLLYSPDAVTHGAGPSNISVGGLAVLDLATGDTEMLFDDNVVEALWGPDGQAFAYILATPSTYELRWRDAGGADRLLASDVTFTWAVSPDGQAVAFTRESGYGLPGTPGLYAVPVAGGAERMLSDVDKGGTGSIDDRPAWSFDSRHVLLSTWSGPEDPRTVIAAADGSGAHDLAFDPTYASEPWFSESMFSVLWHPDGRQLVAMPTLSAGMGGPSPVLILQLDEDMRRAVSAAPFGEAAGVLDWDAPGRTLWVFTQDGTVERLALP